MIQNVLEIIWLFLGAGLANMTPVFAARLPGLKAWNTPLDFGKKFRGRDVFGKNKTWRGLVSGIIIATLTVYLQQTVLKILDTDIVIYSQSFIELPTVLLGIALGAGALLGDAIESFFKRQIGIAPGKSWFPFDQFDYIIGATILTYPIVSLSLDLYLVMFVVGFVLHLLVNYIAYLLKLKDDII